VRTSLLSRTRGILTAAVAVGFLASGALVWQSSRAAFTASTDNRGNSWSAGTLSLSENGVSSTLFDATGLKPGTTGSGCVDVTYGGSVHAVVKLYALTSGPLAPFVNLTIEAGDPGCAGARSAVYTGTLAGLGSTAGDFAHGVDTWAPAGRSGARRGYHVTWALRDDNAAQGLAATTRFTWEAQSS
jgi:hypothetical protein